MTDEILTANCSCTAGLLRYCNHVIVLLYRVEFGLSEDFTKLSYTEVECMFNDISKKLGKGCKMNHIPYAKHIVGTNPNKQSIKIKMH